MRAWYISFTDHSACKKARIWAFLWLDRKRTDDLRCSNLPKCRHPLVVVDFSLHLCLRNEQWIHRRVRIEISAGSVYLNLKNLQIEISSIEIFSISSYNKKLQSKIHRSFECNLIPATSYSSDKRVHFSNNQFMNGILTWFDCNSSFRKLRIILSDLRFTALFSSCNMVLQPVFFLFTAFGTKRSTSFY